MIRVLYIARYHHESMHRKVDLLAAQPDVCLRYIHPTERATTMPYEQAVVPLRGDLTDPHRLRYGAFAFGLNAFKPDIVYVEEEPDSIAAIQLVLARALFAPRAKLVLYTWQNVNRPKQFVVRAILHAALHAADAIVCANTAAAQLLRCYGYQRPTPVIPAIGVDTDTFKPKLNQKQGGTFTVGYAGRLVPEKGLTVLLDALALCQQQHRLVQLVFMGDGPERAMLQSYAQSLSLNDTNGTNVTFAGALPLPQVAQRMSDFDALVLPSLSTAVWQEQFGRVLTEAMACGVPVIGSRSGAIPEVIGDAGLLFPEGDAVALANCVRQLMDSLDLHAELRARGLARVEAYFTQAQLATQTAAFLRQLSSMGK